MSGHGRRKISRRKSLSMADTVVKIVAFGTSLTAIGGWQGPLQSSLAECLGQPTAIVNIAKSGADSDWGVKAVERVVTERPDAVLIEFAVNDAALHRFISLRRSRSNMREIIERLNAAETHPRVLVMAMNPVSGLRALIRPRLPDFVQAHRQVAQELGARFIDHRPAWANFTAHELKAAIPDTLHPLPNVAARVMVPTIIAHLTDGQCRPREMERPMSEAPFEDASPAGARRRPAPQGPTE